MKHVELIGLVLSLMALPLMCSCGCGLQIFGATPEQERQTIEAVSMMFNHEVNLTIEYTNWEPCDSCTGAYVCPGGPIYVKLEGRAEKACPPGHSALVHELMHHKQYRWAGRCDFEPQHPEDLFGTSGMGGAVRKWMEHFEKEICK